MKTCNVCGETKKMREFYKHQTGKDGRMCRCKVCHRLTVKNRYHGDPEYKRKHNEACNRRIMARYHSDPVVRIKKLLRARMSKAMDGNLKPESSMELIGCTPEFLRGYIAARFRKGMKWGVKGSFEVDHILPIAAFDLTDEWQRKKAFHYTNLQPLTMDENRRKSDKYDPDDLDEYLSQPLVE